MYFDEEEENILCYECWDYADCSDCNKRIRNEKEVQHLIDVYNNLGTCVLCRAIDQHNNESDHEMIMLKKEVQELNIVIEELRLNKTYLKNKIKDLENTNKEKIDLIKQLNEDLEKKKKNERCKCFENQINLLEVGDVNKYIFKDNYIDYILKEDPNDFKKRIKDKFENTLRKNLLKSKIISIFKEDKSKFIELKQKRETKMKLFEKSIKINTIKSKVISCLRNLSLNKNITDKTIETIKKYKEKIIFEDEELNRCAINNNRTKINFFSKLYEKKEIIKTISTKDFKLAVEEYHVDKNITRITKISKICYSLRNNNNKIWDSNIIFKSLYIFQYIEDYQIEYLIKEIEKLL
jgi:hypothetical protein